MSEIASAFVSILPSAKGFGSKLDSEISGDMKSSGKTAGARFGTALKAGLLVGGVALGAFLKGAVAEGREAQKVGALTNAVIKSTGGIANVTAGQVDKLATSISLKTGVDDEAIAAGENMLLTFGNVRNELGKGNDIFNQATIAATDMAAAFGGDAVGNSKLLGKALNDPTAGVSALTRVGVSFTTQQKDQIKTLQASGNVLGAQKIILGELSKQTKGAAESQATAGDKFRTAFANLQESVGTLLIPVLDRFLNAMSKVAIFLTTQVGPGLSSVKGLVSPLVAQFTAFAGSVGAAFSGGGATLDAFRLSLSTIGAALSAAFGSGGGGQALAGIKSFVSSIVAGLIPASQQVGAVLRETVLPAFTAFAVLVIGQIVPVMQAMSATFTGLVLPALRSLGGYLSSNLTPLFSNVAAIITGQVIPIIGKLALFFYGTLYPAIIKIVIAVAGKLKPIFDQLAATFRGSVLPTVSKLLAKFEEYRPTIQKVIVAVAKVAGAVLIFAAAVLGKVLPPVIKFAGFLISTLVPAIATVIGVAITIAAKIIAIGAAFIDGVHKVGQFATAVGNKITAAITSVKAIPGKVTAVFSSAGTLLYDAGVKLLDGLIGGIASKIQAVKDKMSAVGNAIKGFLPGSPIKFGPLKSWNNGGAGKRLMDLVAMGIADATPKTVKAAQSAFAKIGDALKSERDGLKSTLDGLKGDFASLADSVAGAFTGNLFEATTGTGFIESLTAKKAELTGLLASFKTLVGFGLDPKFLSQLFASGNGALVTELAGLGQAGAVGAGTLFADVTSLSSTLGNTVATNDPVAGRIDETNRLLVLANDRLEFLGGDIGKALNSVAAQAARKKKKRAKK